MTLALFNPGEWELVFVMAALLWLFQHRNLDELARGLRRGLFEFRKSTRRIANAFDKEASEAGRSVGGIYGKPAAQALRPDNHVAELYDPAAFQRDKELQKPSERAQGRVHLLRCRIRRFLRGMRDRSDGQ